MTDYVTRVLAFVRAKLRAREASSFYDFWKITLICDFTAFYSFLAQANPFLKMWLVSLGVL